ncbi:MAG: phosphopentomutase [Candidatus Sumerlaeaceae bacterium]
MAKRAIIIVLDGVGIGELPDAAEFGDVGSNTLGNLSHAFADGLHLPNMGKLGLGNIATIRGVPADPMAVGAWGKCAEASRGKDTTTGHWEIAGIISSTPFPTYPHGFPDAVIRAVEERIGVGTLGNVVASGTEIIQLLGDAHMATGKLIVYTSADSVFQLAAHEDVIPVEQLYFMCLAARRILDGEHRVGRVIARPFTGTSGNYKRSRNRQDFSVPPTELTVLDRLKDAGYETIGIGKIGDIFDHRGLTQELHTKSNEEGILTTLIQINESREGLIFTNLVDTDMIFGHRNDIKGFKGALEYFDKFLPKIMQALHKDDLLIITADHGVDPTTASTDHSREYAPLLVYNRQMQAGIDLGVRTTFADTAASILEFFGLHGGGSGTSYLNEVLPTRAVAAAGKQ